MSRLADCTCARLGPLRFAHLQTGMLFGFTLSQIDHIALFEGSQLGVFSGQFLGIEGKQR